LSFPGSRVGLERIVPPSSFLLPVAPGRDENDERDKCRAASLAAADAQAQSARLQKQQQDAHWEITALRHSLAASQSALDILKEQEVKVGVHIAAF